MTERRSHWDDKLIEAVEDKMYHCLDCLEDDYPDVDPHDDEALRAAWAHAVIAAVEDWQRDHAVIGHLYGRAEKAEARIQAVRDELDERRTRKKNPTNLILVSDVYAALDGEYESAPDQYRRSERLPTPPCDGHGI